VQLQTLFK